MNIFLLDADEWRHDILGLAGNPIVKTPSLDALAGEGGRFTESCVTTAICGVSRGKSLYREVDVRSRMPWIQDVRYADVSNLFLIVSERGLLCRARWQWHNGKIPAKEFDYSRLYFGRHLS